MLAAILAGATVIALLGWTLWTLSTHAPLDSERIQPAVVPSPTQHERVPVELPVARDPPSQPNGEAPPRPIEAPQGPPLGPDGVLGLVLDADTGEPLQVFQVNVLKAEPGNPLERLRDSLSHPFHVLTGVFFLEQQPGSWDVVVQAPGYEPSVLTGVPTPARERAPLRFELSRGPGIVGLVLNEALMPVAGIATFLHVTELFDPDAKMPLIRTTSTGADGRFSYSPLPDGDYSVSLLEPDNTVDRAGGVRVSGDTVKIDIFLHPRHQLTVHIQSDDGSPLADVLVEVRSTEAHFGHGKTNENGLVLIEYLPDGQYTLKASLAGLAPHVEELELFGGVSDEVRWLTLSP